MTYVHKTKTIHCHESSVSDGQPAIVESCATLLTTMGPQRTELLLASTFQLDMCHIQQSGHSEHPVMLRSDTTLFFMQDHQDNLYRNCTALVTTGTLV